MDYKKVNPSKILCLSFSDKSVNDLEDKINKIFSDKFEDKPIKVSTFHSLGLSFIKDDLVGVIEKKEEITPIFKKFILDKLYEDKGLNVFFFEKLKLNFPEIFRNKYEFKTESNALVKPKGIKLYSYKFASLKKDCVVRSFPELIIADFLFLNDIDFSYGETYSLSEQIKSENRSYLNNKEKIAFDFCINDGKTKIYIDDIRSESNNRDSKTNLSYDLTNSHDKINFNHYVYLVNSLKTKELENNLLILNSSKDYTNFYSSEQRKNFLNLLKDKLNKKGVKLNPKNHKKRDLEKILEDIGFFEELDFLMNYFINFIDLFKQHNFDKEKFSQFNGKSNREKFFLEIVEEFYDYYQDYLAKEKKIDFNDMIIKGMANIKNTSYDYIFVDEYQDISKIRFEFLNTLLHDSGAKLIVVGDDWQSIYGFTGCEIKYFLNFDECFKDFEVEEIILYETYRFSNELIEITKDFITKDEELINRNLFSSNTDVIPKEIIEIEKSEEIERFDGNDSIIFDDEYSLKKPVEILKYTKDNHQKFLIFSILKGISHNYKIGLCGNEVMILSRYNERLDKLEKDLFKYFDYNKYGLNVKFSTIHGSKGLEADNVIIMDFNNHTKGIPSKIKEEKLLHFVNPEDDKNIREENMYNEERRVFYVALSRTKNKVYLCCEKNKESKFYLELLQKNRNLIKVRQFRYSSDFNPFRVQVASVLNKYWNKKENKILIKHFNYLCPECGKKLALYELGDYRVIVCSDYDNCGYYVKDLIRTTDDFKLIKCPKCKKGFLYSNIEGYKSTVIKRYCSNNNCKNYKTKKGKVKEIDADEKPLDFYCDITFKK